MGVAGRHRGKRAVFLKQLQSGLLLVTGPLKINGVPLRRVNQKYVLPTSTKLELGSVAIPERVDDKYFARVELNAQDQQDQKVVDASIIAAAKKVPHMVNYLGSNFALRNG